MSDQSTFGSEFLDALDRELSCKAFLYAERQEVRLLDKSAIVDRFSLNRIDGFECESLTPEDAAEFVGQEVRKATASSSSSMDLAVCSLEAVANLLSILN